MAQARVTSSASASVSPKGYATLGRIGFEGRFDYAAIGTVVNLAARLCSEAVDGQILIDRKVHAAVEALATIEPAGEFLLKGLHRPVAAFNVLACRPNLPLCARRVRRSAPGPSAFGSVQRYRLRRPNDR